MIASKKVLATSRAVSEVTGRVLKRSAAVGGDGGRTRARFLEGVHETAIRDPHAGGVRVLDDDRGGDGEFEGKLQRRVDVDDVVVARAPSLQLLGPSQRRLVGQTWCRRRDDAAWCGFSPYRSPGASATGP